MWKIHFLLKLWQVSGWDRCQFFIGRGGATETWKRRRKVPRSARLFGRELSACVSRARPVYTGFLKRLNCTLHNICIKSSFPAQSKYSITSARDCTLNHNWTSSLKCPGPGVSQLGQSRMWCWASQKEQRQWAWSNLGLVLFWCNSNHLSRVIPDLQQGQRG